MLVIFLIYINAKYLDKDGIVNIVSHDLWHKSNVFTMRELGVMSLYIFSLSGRNKVYERVECDSLSDARNKAVKYLGAYLIEHPSFADDGHWRVNVEDEAHTELFHVIVATVTSRHAKRLSNSADL